MLLVRHNTPLLVDVTVTRPTAKTELRLRHGAALASAGAAEKRKHKTYNAACERDGLGWGDVRHAYVHQQPVQQPSVVHGSQHMLLHERLDRGSLCHSCVRDSVRERAGHVHRPRRVHLCIWLEWLHMR